jgi:glycosyltransferase involved in cell wall biosynthesis
VGADDVTYDRRPAGYSNYRDKLLAEVGDRLDHNRVHFVGHLKHHQHRAVLQVSSVHVYFTYPFVLSWSLIEAMACGCLIVASKTPPVEEVISDTKNGLLVDFLDHEGLSDRVCHALRWRQRLDSIRAAARDTALKRFDLRSVCLPAHLQLYSRLAGRR